VWGGLIVCAVIAFGFGIASSNQTFDSGPLTHEAQAGLDFLVSGIMGATGVIILMVQLGVRIVQLTVRAERTA
jgi:hypothetical protein